MLKTQSYVIPRRYETRAWGFTFAALLLAILFVGCTKGTSTGSDGIYRTKYFSFTVPEPWYYAIPKPEKTNIARCFLHSKLEVSAQGIFLVDAGKSTRNLEDSISSMKDIMSHGTNVPIQRSEVNVDGSSAVLLKSDVAAYRTPCAVIICEHDGKLFLIMLSVSKANQMEYRDAMIESVLATWKWTSTIGGQSTSSFSQEHQDSGSLLDEDQSLYREVSETQVDEFAYKLLRAIESEDLKVADELVNMSYIVKLAGEKVLVPVALKQQFLSNASTKSIMANLFEQVRGHGSFRYLRQRKEEGLSLPVFRFVQANGGVAYHEFKLVENSNGMVLASDFRSSVTGEWMQSDFRNTFLKLDSAAKKGKDETMLLEKHLSILNNMLQASQSQNGMEQALKDFRSTPLEIQADRRYLAMAVSIASQISREEFEIEAERFRKFVPSGPVVDLVMFNLLIEQKRSEEALAAINRVDDWIGGDVFLDLLRAKAYLEDGQLEKAYELCERVRNELPGIYGIYRTCIVVAARKRDFAQINRLIEELEMRFGEAIDLDQIYNDEELSEYVTSLDFEKVRESFEVTIAN